eukprot:1933263-Alexandrium_andersonii.AAC.1
MEGAVWQDGRAGTAAHSGRTVGPPGHFDQRAGRPYCLGSSHRKGPEALSLLGTRVAVRSAR